MSILSVKSDSDNTKETIREASTDVAHEFKCFVSDIENMLKETASLTGDELARAKMKLNQRINVAKQHINNASDTVLQQARKAATNTNEYVHEKPWAVIGVGALASFALGMLIGKKNVSH